MTPTPKPGPWMTGLAPKDRAIILVGALSNPASPEPWGENIVTDAIYFNGEWCFASNCLAIAQAPGDVLTIHFWSERIATQKENPILPSFARAVLSQVPYACLAPEQNYSVKLPGAVLNIVRDVLAGKHQPVSLAIAAGEGRME